MKKILIFLIIASLGLVGCASNTQQENTGIGAVSGGVLGGLAGAAVGGGAAGVAIGAVGGAIVGGLIGHSMESSDTTATYTAMNGTTYKSTTWHNNHTGARYTVTPVSGYMTINGNPNCRKFKTVAIENGKTYRWYGYACRQSNGTWVSVRR